MTVITRTDRGWKLGYVAMRGGITLREPNRLERLFVAVWNRTHCFLFGHDRILGQIPEAWEADGTFHCTACCTKLKP